MRTILVVEDDPDMREGLALSLEGEGYRVWTAESACKGLELAKQGCDAILLDCNLPDGNGFDFCVRIKERSDTPVLMLTARDTEMDEVRALELGMDDFLSKPFSLAVLKARLKRLLPKDKEKKETRLTSCGIAVDRDCCKVYKGDAEISCSRLEYRLLLYFMEHKNRVLSKEQILAAVWDSQGKFVDDSTVSVTVKRLRTKIGEDSGRPRILKTVYGIGYIWKEE